MKPEAFADLRRRSREYSFQRTFLPRQVERYVYNSLADSRRTRTLPRESNRRLAGPAALFQVRYMNIPAGQAIGRWMVRAGGAGRVAAALNLTVTRGESTASWGDTAFDNPPSTR